VLLAHLPPGRLARVKIRRQRRASDFPDRLSRRVVLLYTTRR
jgi:hypothetical protein